MNLYRISSSQVFGVEFKHVQRAHTKAYPPFKSQSSSQNGTDLLHRPCAGPLHGDEFHPYGAPVEVVSEN